MNITTVKDFQTSIEGIILLIEDELPKLDKLEVAKAGKFTIRITNSDMISDDNLEIVEDKYMTAGGFSKVSHKRTHKEILITFVLPKFKTE